MGLVGVSTQISRVSGVTAASTAARSAMFTNENLSPAERAFTRANRR